MTLPSKAKINLQQLHFLPPDFPSPDYFSTVSSINSKNSSFLLSKFNYLTGQITKFCLSFFLPKYKILANLRPTSTQLPYIMKQHQNIFPYSNTFNTSVPETHSMIPKAAKPTQLHVIIKKYVFYI